MIVWQRILLESKIINGRYAIMLLSVELIYGWNWLVVHIFFTASSNPTYSLTLCTLINISQYHKKSTISRQTSIWPVWDGVFHVP